MASDSVYGGGVEQTAPIIPPDDSSSGRVTPDAESTASTSTGTSTATGTTGGVDVSYAGMDTSKYSAGNSIMNALVCYVACLLRAIITPELWLQFTPGRWLAFVVATAKVESSFQANAVNGVSGAGGLLQYLPSNQRTLGVKWSSVWSQGWHCPELLAHSVTTLTWWFRAFFGATAIRALWHYGPDDTDGLEKAAQETTFRNWYYAVRVPALLLDVPYLLLTAGLMAMLLGRKVMRRRRKR